MKIKDSPIFSKFFFLRFKYSAVDIAHTLRNKNVTSDSGAQNIKKKKNKGRFMLNPLLMSVGSPQETRGRKFSSLECKWNDFCTCRKEPVQRQGWRLQDMWELKLVEADLMRWGQFHSQLCLKVSQEHLDISCHGQLLLIPAVNSLVVNDNWINLGCLPGKDSTFILTCQNFRKRNFKLISWNWFMNY